MRNFKPALAFFVLYLMTGPHHRTSAEPFDMTMSGSASMTDNHVFMGFGNQPSNSQGFVTVFSRRNDNWAVTSILQAPDNAPQASFGSAIKMTDTMAVIGAPFANSRNQAKTGAVYLYTKRGQKWSFQRKLFANDGQEQDQFGYSVEVENNAVAVGAPFRRTPNIEAIGAVYIFLRANAWNQPMRLLPPSQQAFAYFGYSLAAMKRYLVVGAVGQRVGDSASVGIALVYSTNLIQANLVRIIVPPSTQSSQYFGSSIAIFGSFLAITSPGRFLSNAFAKGAVHVYGAQGNIILKTQDFVVLRSLGIDSFANSVAMNEKFILVGASNPNTLTGVQGAATVVYSRVGDRWSFSSVFRSRSSSSAIDTPVVVSLGNQYAFVAGESYFTRPVTIDVSNMILSLPKEGIASPSESPSPSKITTFSPSNILSTEPENTNSNIFTRTQSPSPSFSQLTSESSNETGFGSESNTESSSPQITASEVTPEISSQASISSTNENVDYVATKDEFARRILEVYKLAQDEKDYQVTEQQTPSNRSSTSDEQNFAWVFVVVGTFITLLVKANLSMASSSNNPSEQRAIMSA